MLGTTAVLLGGITQYRTIRDLRAGIGRYAYGNPLGFGTWEFKPKGVYIGKVIDLKIYILPSEENDIPGFQIRYLIRRETSNGKVYEGYFSTDLVTLKSEPPQDEVIGPFPPIDSIFSNSG